MITEKVVEPKLSDVGQKEDYLVRIYDYIHYQQFMILLLGSDVIMNKL